MMHCPQCGGEGIYLGEMSESWYRCRQCGWDFPESDGEHSILPEDE